MKAPRTNQSAARLAAMTARFETRINKNGPIIRPELGPCWIWTGTRNAKGYGVTELDGVSGAHRIALSIATGGERAGMLAIHSCDNPPCCNPGHLRWGTTLDNARDAKDRGRNAHGERNGSAKLTASQAREAREAFAAGEAKASIAVRLGVTEVLVHYVVIGRIWKRAGGPIAPHAKHAKSSYACSVCGSKGHNRRKCAARERAA